MTRSNHHTPGSAPKGDKVPSDPGYQVAKVCAIEDALFRFPLLVRRHPEQFRVVVTYLRSRFRDELYRFTVEEPALLGINVPVIVDRLDNP